MRGIRSQPTEQPQKRFLHKYWKKDKPFQISSKPLPGTQFKVELKPYFDQTKAVFASVEADIAEDTPRCGKDHCRCCFGVVRMSLAEALYLQFRVNTELTSSVRHQVIYRALHPQNADGSGADESQRSCPLLLDNTCILYDFRPVQCRVFGWRQKEKWAFIRVCRLHNALQKPPHPAPKAE
jgi:Fe-S-cluster containining protein